MESYAEVTVKRLVKGSGAISITVIEAMGILRIKPLDQFGQPLVIVELFGDRAQYQRVVIELVNEIYKVMRIQLKENNYE